VLHGANNPWERADVSPSGIKLKTESLLFIKKLMEEGRLAVIDRTYPLNKL